MRTNRIVFMNAPILTAEGVWRYRRLGGARAAKEFIAGVTWDRGGHDELPRLSAVGHEATAQAMTELLGENVPLNRINFKAEEGDACLVMKLRGRIEEGRVLDRKALDEIGYDFFIMEYAAEELQVVMSRAADLAAEIFELMRSVKRNNDGLRIHLQPEHSLDEAYARLCDWIAQSRTWSIRSRQASESSYETTPEGEN